MSNVANLVAGLLDERAAAERVDNQHLVAQIDEQLETAREQLEEYEPAGVDEEAQRKYVTAVRRRLAAFDRGEGDPDNTPAAEPRVHNAANYMTGLLDERDAALRAGRLVDDIDAEIERVRHHLEQFQPLDDEAEAAKKHAAAVRRRLSDLGRTSRKASAQQEQQDETPQDTPEGGEREQEKAPRTTKAASPPRRAGSKND